MTRREDTPTKASATPPTTGSTSGGTVLLDGRELSKNLRQHEEEAAIHYVVVVEGPDAGTRFQIDNGTKTLGRAADVDFVLNDGSVSSRHCQLQLLGEQLHVEDLGSSNGTFLGAEAVTRARVPVGTSLRVGTSVLQHEHRSPSEVAEHDDLDHDIEKAVQYLESLLPEPFDGRRISARWLFRPSTRLGGDGFGYHWVDESHLALYLLDVCGHGTGSSLHAVSVLQLLRTLALPDVDFRDPAQVLSALNESFQMERHAGMYFTAWYGVFETSSRRLRFASAGHPPALLLTGGERRRLQTKRPAIGLMPGIEFHNDATELDGAGRLILFSDGAFEIDDPRQTGWNLETFLALPRDAAALDAERELKRLEAELVAVQENEQFDDDLSIVVADFSP